jgi:excisionase family DNA binding protein
VPDMSYQPPEGYLTMAQAAERISVSLVTLRKLIQRRGIQTYQDPGDARAKLVKLEDVARLREPIPLQPIEPKKAAA